MRCPECQDQLSAYYDHQLTARMHKQVGRHVDQCAQCAAELATFGSLSKMANVRKDPDPPAGMWSHIETVLQKEPVVRATVRPRGGSRHVMRWVMIAASILLMAGIGGTAYRVWFGAHSHGLHVADMTSYLELFEENPQHALEMLVAKYDGQSVDLADAASKLGYRSASAAVLAGEYTVKQAYILKMPCCECVQCLCHTPDGRTLAVFEHKEEQPMAFGKRPSVQARCGGKPCRIVQFGDRLAVSWQQDGRHLTVVGARDLDEVEKLMTAIEKRANDPRS